jgi:hypothetical protein
MRRPIRSLLAALPLALLAAAPARAGNSSWVLLDGSEVCTNGARFSVKAADSLAVGPTMIGQVFTAGDVFVEDGSTHVFGAIGERLRFEVDYSAAPQSAGTTVKLSVSETPGALEGSFGHSLAVTVEACELLGNGEFDHGGDWVAGGAVETLTDAEFDYDGDGTGDDLEELGNFALL